MKNRYISLNIIKQRSVSKGIVAAFLALSITLAPVNVSHIFAEGLQGPEPTMISGLSETAEETPPAGSTPDEGSSGDASDEGETPPEGTGDDSTGNTETDEDTDPSDNEDTDLTDGEEGNNSDNDPDLSEENSESLDAEIKALDEDEELELLEYSDGTVIIDGVTYQYYANGEASLVYADFPNGPFEVPATITGTDGQDYLVTAIGPNSNNPLVSPFTHGNNMRLTGLSFAPDSQLKTISAYAFANCYGLVGTRIVLPDTVTYVGKDAFNLSDMGTPAYLKHPHLAGVTGSLPDLSAGDPFDVPDAAKTYESMVDSTQYNTMLHKGASWTNETLTEAEIRIDYGKHPNRSARVDFVFVLDYSVSMLESTTVTLADGQTGTYPRSFLMNDVVTSISKLLLAQGTSPANMAYDNRVALCTFGTGSLWTSDFGGDSAFTQDADAVEEMLFANPLTMTNSTYYDSGLTSAIELINNRNDTSRPAVIIFLSDGRPTSGHEGLSQATTLRNDGVKVYPIGIYLDAAEESAISNLEAISYDGSTAYRARDTDTFEAMMMDIIDTVIEQNSSLYMDIDDILSEHFEPLTGTQSDLILTSGNGTATLNGNTITWTLENEDSEVTHFMRIKARLKTGTELTASGTLPTNSSLSVTTDGITASSQPELTRYLARHVFKNGSEPDEELPEDVMELLPPAKGGYRDGVTVTPNDPSSTAVEISATEKWIFMGWDKTTDTIDEADAIFTGVWINAAESFSFTKTDLDGNALTGASFDLYQWSGSEAPGDADHYITAENISAGKWVKTNADPIMGDADGVTILTFPEEGIYQLVEVTAPTDHYLPEVQWRFEVDDTLSVDSIDTMPLSEEALLVDFIRTTEGDTEIWSLPNYAQTEFSFLKVSAAHYHDGEVSEEALAGAVFELYFWTADTAPSDTALIDSSSSIQADWALIDTLTSGSDGKVSFTIPTKSTGYYQVVEKQAPENFLLPSGQWRINMTKHTDSNSYTYTITGIAGADGTIPPPLQIKTEGPFDGKLTLTNIPHYDLPITGGSGVGPFIFAGILLLLTGISIRIFIAVRTFLRLKVFGSAGENAGGPG